MIRELTITNFKSVDSLRLELGRVNVFIGANGSGKTTSSGKLARVLHKQARTPLLVAADVYRPAAMEHQVFKQCKFLARQGYGVPVAGHDALHTP